MSDVVIWTEEHSAGEVGLILSTATVAAWTTSSVLEANAAARVKYTEFQRSPELLKTGVKHLSRPIDSTEHTVCAKDRLGRVLADEWSSVLQSGTTS